MSAPDALPPLSLYIHLPWCERKCPYCDFNSFEIRGPVDETGYVAALLRDLEFELAATDAAQSRPIESVFVGGGTPSLFSGPAIGRLLDGVRARAVFADDCEITLEANPGTAEAGRFADYARAGVTRLSIGIQSFRDPQLRVLGRVHDGHDAARAIALAGDAGFGNFNVDLMYALPGDDIDGALEDLDAALIHAPSHLSWYQLTMEPGTVFHRSPPPLPPEDTVLAIERAGRERLRQAGYERYEISGYARQGFRCRHNLNYWRFGDYIGIGAGAHGKLTLADGVVERRAKTRNPRSYRAAAGTSAAVSRERIDDREQLVVEFLMNALRLTDGVDTALFEARTGESAERLAAARDEGERRGWLQADPARLAATPAGLQVLNRVLALF